MASRKPARRGSLELARINVERLEGKGPVIAALVESHPDAAVLGVRDLCDLFGLSARTIYRMKSEGSLPDSIKIGQRRFWRLSDLKDFINSRFEAGADQ